MKCEEVFHLIQRGLDNDLTSAEEESLRMHLADCSSCQAASEQLSGLHHGLASLPKVNPPYSIVDAMLSDIDALGETEVKVTEVKPINRKRVKKRFWMPGLAMVAGLFIALILLNERDLSSLEETSLSSGEPELAMTQSESTSANETIADDRVRMLKDPEENINSFAVPSEEEPPMDKDIKVDGPGQESIPGQQDENEEGPALSLTGVTVDEEEKYPSPDGVYTAYLGLHHEEIFIDKEGEAYYISKNSWKAPWVVEEITWVHNEQLYYVLYYPEYDDYQYWLIDVKDRTEEQLEEALRN